MMAAFVLMMSIPGLSLFYSGRQSPRPIWPPAPVRRPGARSPASAQSCPPAAMCKGHGDAGGVDQRPSGTAYVPLKLVGVFVALRVFREHEIKGLDISQHGEALQ
ncbi:hypothetical protein RPD_0450 [Rhodopseudomonas palustris BisB5]|uniref:Ammonium transporter AmtB-like domain-containing protein n=1 Tax=Rhodopseudomonas palustris (strain BisB5) TaxID=316057 RepID=Q13E01_RHOPS|nr:hypothetical protein RPD_0450 [Rhodopseudomonas palustris BisB5]